MAARPPRREGRAEGWIRRWWLCPVNPLEPTLVTKMCDFVPKACLLPSQYSQATLFLKCCVPFKRLPAVTSDIKMGWQNCSVPHLCYHFSFLCLVHLHPLSKNSILILLPNENSFLPFPGKGSCFSGVKDSLLQEGMN